MIKTIEAKVAAAILVDRTELKAGGKIYQVAPPTIRTLIAVSAKISELPTITPDPESIFLEAMVIAADCEVLGMILSLLILGAKKTKPRWSIFRTRDQHQKLADELLANLSPSEFNIAITEVLKGMEIADFFSITASLVGINLLRATRETETTASGPSLQESPKATR